MPVIFLHRKSVGNGGYVCIAQESASATTLLKPAPHCHKTDVGSGVDAMLLALHRGGEVVAGAVEEWACMALRRVIVAGIGVVANSGAAPHVVHNPEQRFAERCDFFDGAERHRALVYPVYDYCIGICHKRMAREVKAAGGGRDLEQIGAAEAVASENSEPFGKEICFSAQIVAISHDIAVAAMCRGMHHKHTRIDPLALQGFEEAVRRHCGTANAIALIDDYNLHSADVLALYSGSKVASTMRILRSEVRASR